MHKQNDASIRLFVFLIHADPSVSPCIIKIVFKDQAGLLRVELIVFLFRLFCTFPIGFLAKRVTTVSVVPPGGLAALQFSSVAPGRSMRFIEESRGLPNMLLGVKETGV